MDDRGKETDLQKDAPRQTETDSLRERHTDMEMGNRERQTNLVKDRQKQTKAHTFTQRQTETD